MAVLPRIIDGKGYQSDTEARGHRGYNEPMMFVEVGAVVEIPQPVYKRLAQLGSKLYFLRLSKNDKDKAEKVKRVQEDWPKTENKGIWPWFII